MTRISCHCSDSSDAPQVGLRDDVEAYTSLDDAGSIASVYLDNEELDSYRTRLERREGANLVRIRWYGDLWQGSGQGTGGVVFVERKTHHESWTQDKSTKERFPMRCGDVPVRVRSSQGHVRSAAYRAPPPPPSRFPTRRASSTARMTLRHSCASESRQGR